MLTDVKTWLETTGYKVAEERFLKPPAQPYIIFVDNTEVGGADNKNCIADRQISVELYSDKINNEAEQKIEGLLNGKVIHYSKVRAWIQTEMFFQTLYEFNLIEKL
ncbi:hypothetical protein LY28_01347 [Ruminiclostridium sufflavum DSM 19573]|uniref:Uncharacterized protein n=1 Tax=Ruminiclostridium sufflavum DSM 19573 TaxID=1121337 RepID=A0A318XLJ6_9FIRM|nr:hypothetical protein [Ruminiclostridium sufflavum]PYG88498.1 hypothetical protein LY28_01347 [Ruminiclostridium sufflavum DSM 19573]